MIKNKKYEVVFKILDKVSGEYVSRVEINHYDATKRNKIVTSENTKLTTFFSLVHVKSIYAPLIKNAQMVKTLNQRHREIRRGLLSRPDEPTKKNRYEASLEEISKTLENINETINRGKQWQLVVAQIVTDKKDMLPLIQKEKIKLEAVSDLKKIIIHDLTAQGLLSKFNCDEIDFYIREKKQKRSKLSGMGFFVQMTSIGGYPYNRQNGASPFQTVREAGIAAYSIGQTSNYHPAFYVKTVEDLHLLKLLLSNSYKVEKEFNEEDINQSYQKIIKQVENQVEKYCGF